MRNIHYNEKKIEGKIMFRISRKVVTDKCERCGRVVLLDFVRDELGRQMLLCEQCITTAGVEGLTDPLKNIKWPKK